jgi:putative membrane protein
MKLIWLITYMTFFIWSAIAPKDYPTWFLEVIPAIMGAAILALTYKCFQLTKLVYTLILLHCIILFIGGHYTYAEVPLFDVLKETFHWHRNNYDKVGHIMQGFAPAMIAREILIRKNIIQFPKWRDFFIICFCLALSAFYELLEWVVAVLTGDSAKAFLGTQGYIWDTQSDMAFALLGAILALVFLSSIHDHQIQTMTNHYTGPRSVPPRKAGKN